MERYSIIKDLLFVYSSLGIKNTMLGATLIGKTPHIAPEAWANCLYPPISVEVLKNMEQQIGVEIPPSYKQFLTGFSNGLDVLTSTLYLYGKRGNYNRNNIEFAWQPYDLVDMNLYEKPKNASREMLFIGGYNWDGSNLYMMPDQTVHYCARNDATSLHQWPSLLDMLIEELNRLYGLFDTKGVKINDNTPTIPI